MYHQKKQILVVDDDLEIRELLSAYLTKEGYNVISARNGSEMKAKLAAQHHDLILLDIMLPGDDGFTLCKDIRQTSNIPIIILTAVSDETDQIIGLEVGADDYIAKPFSPRQLVARIRALLRRADALPKYYKKQVITFADWQATADNLMLKHLISGKEIELTNADHALLMLFIANTYKLLDRNHISNALKGRDALPQERGIDVQVSRLRQRLKDRDGLIIKTIRGNGYIFSAEIDYAAMG